jgi:hypothetical protein
MEQKETVVPQDEIKEEETFEVDESETEEEVEEESSEDEENSTQLREELKKQKEETAKLQRLLKKEAKKAEESTTESNISKEDLERIRLTAKGYEDDEIDLVMELGGVEKLQNPVVQKAVEAIRTEKKQASAQASGKTQSKPKRTFTKTELQSMPLDKLEQMIKDGKIK